MEDSKSNHATQQVYKEFAYFELISTFLILIAVACSCVEGYLGHSPDFLSMINVFGVVPMNTAECLNLFIDDRNLAIGLIVAFCILCAINIFLKLRNIVFGNNTTSLLSWVILLLSVILSGIMIRILAVAEQGGRAEAFWYGGGHTTFGGGAWLLIAGTFLLFMVLVIKVMDSPATPVKKAEPEAEPVLDEPGVEQNHELNAIVEEVKVTNSAENTQPNPPKSGHTKWFVFGGCTIALLALFAWMLWGNHASSRSFDNLPMEQVFPKVKKVVEVKADMVNLRLGPGEDYDIVRFEDPGMMPVEVQAYKGQLLAVLEEEDGWYKIASWYNKPIEGYINAAYCSDVSYGGLSDEPHRYYWSDADDEYNIVHRSEDNHLIVLYGESEYAVNKLRLGIYQDGLYIFWYCIPVINLSYVGEKLGFELKPDEEGILYEGWFGNDMAQSVNENGIEWQILDWNKLSETQLAELFHSEIVNEKKIPYIVNAQMMEANGNLKSRRIE